MPPPTTRMSKRTSSMVFGVVTPSNTSVVCVVQVRSVPPRVLIALASAMGVGVSIDVNTARSSGALVMSDCGSASAVGFVSRTMVVAVGSVFIACPVAVGVGVSVGSVGGSLSSYAY